MTNMDIFTDEIINNSCKVCLDSRLIKKGEYFVAVKGENHDGHKFIPEVLAKGAAGILEVSDIYELVKFKMEKVNPVVIGITGSTGKTSVTNYITQILSTKYNVCKGSLNTKLGLSVDVLNNMNLDCKFFVAEMGMDAIGQIKDMVSIFPPHIGVITTINETHIEKLGSIENIALAKSEIFSNSTEKDTAVLNFNNPYTSKIGKEFKGKVIWFGDSNEADFNLENTDLSKSKLLGHHNKVNLLAVIAVCSQVGMSMEEIKDALPFLSNPKGRLNIIEGIEDSTIIDDTYNSSPESCRAAINVLTEFPKENKIAILGDMLELGNFSLNSHKKVGEYFQNKDIKILVTVGKLSVEIANGAKEHVSEIYSIETWKDFESIKEKILIDKNTVVLIKASQGIRLEKITKTLMKKPELAPDLLVRQDERWS
jgi:UDP-N-acetylmuramoyl-tripeptide--D-alanyl-D-alanine ligase